MHKYTDDTRDSRVTLAGGRKGVVVGALVGAALFGLIALILDMLQVGTGGAVLSAMAGAAVGGLGGLIIGAMRSRPREYASAERRFNTAPYSGVERRLAR
jgi:hypothetical protein